LIARAFFSHTKLNNSLEFNSTYPATIIAARVNNLSWILLCFKCGCFPFLGLPCMLNSIKEGFPMSNSLDAIRADQQNFLDDTEDEVKELPATTDVNEAVEAITAHINKYDVNEENE
jgi:hypothetical protein